MHPHHAAARRARRRGQDVEVARQLRRHRRAAAGDVRQADVDLGRADVALHRAAVVRVCWTTIEALEAKRAGAIRATSRCASPRRSWRASTVRAAAERAQADFDQPLPRGRDARGDARSHDQGARRRHADRSAAQAGAAHAEHFGSAAHDRAGRREARRRARVGQGAEDCRRPHGRRPGWQAQVGEDHRQVDVTRSTRSSTRTTRGYGRRTSSAAIRTTGRCRSTISCG